MGWGGATGVVTSSTDITGQVSNASSARAGRYRKALAAGYTADAIGPQRNWQNRKDQYATSAHGAELAPAVINARRTSVALSAEHRALKCAACVSDPSSKRTYSTLGTQPNVSCEGRTYRPTAHHCV